MGKELPNDYTTDRSVLYRPVLRESLCFAVSSAPRAMLSLNLYIIGVVAPGVFSFSSFNLGYFSRINGWMILEETDSVLTEI